MISASERNSDTEEVVLSNNSQFEYSTIPGLRKGSVLYVIDGFLFYKIKSNEKSIHLKCQLSFDNNCPAKAVINQRSNTATLKFARHNHTVESHDKPVRALKTKLKLSSKNSSKPPREIFDEVSREFDQSIAATVAFPSVQRSMHQWRSEKYPHVPHNTNEFYESLINANNFNENFKATIEVDSEIKALLFYSTELITQIDDFNDICYDGTFFIVPSIFTQLFIISVKCDSRFLPVFFSLMTSRSKQDYKMVISKISDLVPAFKPHRAIGDFEKASMAAFKETFPQINCQGCLFHYKQAILRKIGQLHLKSFYTRNNLANQWFTLVIGIGFLPVQSKRNFFQMITSQVFGNITQRSNLAKFIVYFERTWLRDLSLTDWFNAQHYTNNFSESFNKKLKSTFAVHHSNAWIFLEKLNLIIKDIQLENLRIMNNLQTTRQRNPHLLTTLSNELKSQLLNSEIDELTFLKIHLNIEIIEPQIRNIFSRQDYDSKTRLWTF